MGRVDDAVNDFTKCIEISPTYGPAYSNRSGGYFQLKQYDKAKVDADKAIELDPKDADAYINRANAKEMLRDLDGACNDWHKARELGSEIGKYYHSGNCSN